MSAPNPPKETKKQRKSRNAAQSKTQDSATSVPHKDGAGASTGGKSSGEKRPLKSAPPRSTSLEVRPQTQSLSQAVRSTLWPNVEASSFHPSSARVVAIATTAASPMPLASGLEGKPVLATVIGDLNNQSQHAENVIAPQNGLKSRQAPAAATDSGTKTKQPGPRNHQAKPKTDLSAASGLPSGSSEKQGHDASGRPAKVTIKLNPARGPGNAP